MVGSVNVIKFPSKTSPMDRTDEISEGERCVREDKDRRTSSTVISSIFTQAPD
jgi:hypothetical protein